MASDASSPDWAAIRSFLAVAEAGSLTAAARKLGLSQPTMGRHVRAVEARLGTDLFVRGATGLSLSAAGRDLLEPAREMAAASARLGAIAAGHDARFDGTVRITASVVVSSYVLPPILADLRAAEPRIEIELVPSDASENLLFREVDIAVRMYRPTQLDVVARKLAEQPLALYAAPALLERHGVPDSVEALLRLPFVGFDRSDLILRAMREIGLDVDRHFFGVRCDDQAAFWQLVCAGCGVGAMQAVIGDAEPRVRRIDVALDLPILPIWLAAHEGLPRNPRIRRVWDHLAARLGHPG